MNTEMNGKKIKAIYLPDSGNDIGQSITGSPTLSLEFSATHHGDHDEFWVLEFRDIEGKFKEVCRYNPRYLEAILWA